MNRQLASIFLILSGGGLARAQAPDYGRLLVAVHSVQSAQALLGTVTHRDITLDSLATWQQQQCFRYQIHSDSLAQDEYDPCVRHHIGRSEDWHKADFDHDGHPDLFVIDTYSTAYLLLNRGPQQPELLPLEFQSTNFHDCQQFQVIDLGGRAAVVRFCIGYRGSLARQHQVEPTIRHDTLVYHAGAFVGYNATPGPAKQLRKLGYCFRLGGPPKPDPGYNLLVNLRTGQVKSYAKYGYGHVTGTFRYRLSAGLLDTLRRQATYVPVARLASEYARNAFDASSDYFTFYRRGHAPRQVGDYGASGPYALRELAELLGRVHDRAVAQRWQKLQRQRPGQQ